MSENNLYLIIEDLMSNHLAISLERNSITAFVDFDAPELIFSISNLCDLKNFLAEAILVLRSRMKGIVIEPRRHKIKTGNTTLNWAQLKLSPSPPPMSAPASPNSVYMSLKNLMQSKRNITNCIVEMMLNKKKEDACRKRLKALDDGLAGCGHKIRRASGIGWGG